MRRLNEAKEQYYFERVWVIEGKILLKWYDSPSAKPKVYEYYICNSRISFVYFWGLQILILQVPFW